MSPSAGDGKDGPNSAKPGRKYRHQKLRHAGVKMLILIPETLDVVPEESQVEASESGLHHQKQADQMTIYLEESDTDEGQSE